MHGVDELISKLREIESLILEKGPDGAVGYDPYKVLTCLELARRMLLAKKPESQD